MVFLILSNEQRGVTRFESKSERQKQHEQATYCPSFGTKVRAALLIWCSGGVVGGGKNLGVVFFFHFLSLLGAGMGACPVPQECHLDFFYVITLGF